MLNDGFGQIVQPDIRSSVLESGVSKSLLTSSSSQEASGSWCFGIYGVAMALISMLSSVGFVFIVCAVPVNGNADLSCVQISSAEEKDNFIGIGTGINVINRGLVIVVSVTAGFVLLFAEIYSFVFWGLKLGMFKGEMLSQIQNMQSDNLRILASNYGLRLTNISLLGGILIGIAVVVVVYAASVKAVRKTAVKTMDEIGRQAVKSPDADVEKLIADYTVCAAVPMDYSIRFSLIPCLVAVIIPVLAGILFGIPCVIGVFLGSLLTGFVITAVFSRGVE